MEANHNILQNYNEKAVIGGNRLEREGRKTFEAKSFNNWIKAVLIQNQTKKMCRRVEELLDLRRGSQQNKLLHVLDIGCGRGQDILKWKSARVQYMVAMDFSEECIKVYEQKWSRAHEPYRLHTIVGDFTSPTLYPQIQHSFYDIVSAQLCLHYMFGTQEGVKNGLTAILSNLLIEGAFIATIPDSYAILKKIKQKGVNQSDGSRVYGNKYFSIKFNQTSFSNPYGNMYGFYLQEAIGKKNEDGSIQYTNEWLIELDSLSQILRPHGVVIQETMNFIQYYKENRDQYKELFAKFKLIYPPGERMEDDLWQIAHLYRVLICRKKSKGKTISEFNLKERQSSITKEVKSTSRGNYQQGYNRHNNNSHYNNSHYNNSRSYDRGRGGDHSRSRDYGNSRRSNN